MRMRMRTRMGMERREVKIPKDRTSRPVAEVE